MSAGLLGSDQEWQARLRRHYRESVVRGARRFDAQHPGWADEIDLERLDMQDCRRCVGGQLAWAIMHPWVDGELTWHEVRVILEMNWESNPAPGVWFGADQLYGLNVDHGQGHRADWDALGELWIQQIRARQTY